MLMLSIAFALGVLSTVLAVEYERKRRYVIVYAEPFACMSSSARARYAAALIHPPEAK